MEVIQQDNVDQRGPSGQWKVPKEIKLKNGKILEGGKLEGLVNSSFFCTNGTYIMCGLCYDHFPDSCKVECKVGRPYSFGRFGEHIRDSEKHRLSIIAAENTSKRKKRKDNHNKETTPVPKKKQSAIRNFFSPKLSEVDLTANDVNDDMEDGHNEGLTFNLTRTTTTSSTTVCSPILLKRQAQRMMKNMTFVEMMKSLQTSEDHLDIKVPCIGILNITDLDNKVYQRGFFYIHHYFVGWSNDYYSCISIHEPMEIYSIVSKNCTTHVDK